MKLRNDFVTNSSSSSYIIPMKDGSNELKSFIDNHTCKSEYSSCNIFTDIYLCLS